jgi:hypothetical protein
MDEIQLENKTLNFIMDLLSIWTIEFLNLTIISFVLGCFLDENTVPENKKFSSSITPIDFQVNKKNS